MVRIQGKKGSVYLTSDILAAIDQLELLNCAASRNSVLWHDAIPRKRSLCQENVALFMV